MNHSIRTEWKDITEPRLLNIMRQTAVISWGCGKCFFWLNGIIGGISHRPSKKQMLLLSKVSNTGDDKGMFMQLDQSGDENWRVLQDLVGNSNGIPQNSGFQTFFAHFLSGFFSDWNSCFCPFSYNALLPVDKAAKLPSP